MNLKTHQLKKMLLHRRTETLFNANRSQVLTVQIHLTLLYMCTKSASCLARILLRSFKCSFLLGTITLNDCCKLPAALFKNRNTKSCKNYEMLVMFKCLEGLSLFSPSIRSCIVTFKAGWVLQHQVIV